MRLEPGGRGSCTDTAKPRSNDECDIKEYRCETDTSDVRDPEMMRGSGRKNAPDQTRKYCSMVAGHVVTDLRNEASHVHADNTH